MTTREPIPVEVQIGFEDYERLVFLQHQTSIQGIATGATRLGDARLGQLG